MKTIPTIGSEVAVTVRFRNYNYHTSSCQPFNDTVFTGVVVKNSKWIGSEYFCVKTDNKNVYKLYDIDPPNNYYANAIYENGEWHIE